MFLIQGEYKKSINYCKDLFNSNFFEFELPFVPENNRFREIDRFLYESRHTLRFTNEYIGNVVVDISDWNGSEINNYFEAFMFFLKDNSKKYKCALIINERCHNNLLIKLKEFFDLREVELELPPKKQVNKIGFAIDENKGCPNNVRG